MAWKTYLAIDWTHMLHELTYDILAAKDVPWEQKKFYTDDAVRYYLEQHRQGLPRSVAPLDVNAPGGGDDEAVFHSLLQLAKSVQVEG